MENNVNVTLDINAFLKAYDKEEFMRKVFAEALVKNTSILTDALKNYVLIDIIKSDEFENIKKAILLQLLKDISGDDLKNNRAYQSQLNNTVSECVKDMKPKILNQVSNSINQDGIKEKIAKHISSVVEERVTYALGEVCEGCDRDIY